MTEDEAKTKTCPAMRHCVNEAAVIQDGDRPIYMPASCIASACMAWRTKSDWRAEALDGAKSSPGFCGLAGAPL